MSSLQSQNIIKFRKSSTISLDGVQVCNVPNGNIKELKDTKVDRAVTKEGHRNLIPINVLKQKQKYFSDIFTTV